MGILSNTTGLCRYTVTGKLPQGKIEQWAGEKLAANAFRSIEETTDEQSVGWVNLDDFTARDFELPGAFQREHYLAFTLRRDLRKVPAILLRAHLDRAAEEFLAANPGYSRIPRQKREDLRDAHRGRLLARTLPAPSTSDAVWETRAGVVMFTSLSAPVQTRFEELFAETFPGLRLVLEHPYARAARVLPKGLQNALQSANGARSDGALDLIEGNRWLGRDFLAWLLYGTTNSASDYKVGAAGHLPEGTGFTAFIDNRIVLVSDGEEAPGKVTVLGPQANYREARAALSAGKHIGEANLVMELNEHRWSMNLRGERFQLASFKAPPVTIEKDDVTDRMEERTAVFYERMLLIEQGTQLLDSLYKSFLVERLGSAWKGKAKRIGSWFGEEKA